MLRERTAIEAGRGDSDVEAIERKPAERVHEPFARRAGRVVAAHALARGP